MPRKKKKQEVATIEEIVEAAELANPLDAKILERAEHYGLNQKQMLFAVYYASLDEVFGNGAQCYLRVYGPEYLALNKKVMPYMTACVNASRLLSEAKVSQFINELLEMRGLNDTFVDKQLEFLVTQHADFKSKLGAIREYNNLKKRTEQGGNKTLVLVVSGETANRYGVSPT